jgi:hypothetical protein
VAWGVRTFEQAVSDGKGSIDAGYLALFWAMLVTVAMIPLVIVFGAYLAHGHADKASEILMGTAAIVGALGGQCAAVIGAVGVFRMGDKSRAPVVPAPVVAPTDPAVAVSNER